MGYEQAIVEQRESPVRYRMTVRDFLLLDDAGVFPTKHTELIDGEVYILSPIHRPHARAQTLLILAFHEAIVAAALPFEVLAPVSAYLDEHNLPEPDLILADLTPSDHDLAPEERDFVALHAARLVVEVAYSSQRHDLGRKLGLYARKGIAEYWVADLKKRRLVTLHTPADGAYSVRNEVPLGGRVKVGTVPGLTVDLSALEEL